MRMSRTLLATLVTLVVIATTPVMADELPDWVKNTKVSGLAFGDVYYLSGSHNEDLEGQSGFWFRRIYLGFDSTITDHWSARLRFEASNVGDFVTKDKMTPFVKDVFLKWKSGDHALFAGLSGTPTWEVVEDFWGYRSVEKTPFDLQRFGGSRDIGLAYKGSFGEGNLVRLHAMIGNGADVNNEVDNEKKAYVALGFFPKNGLIVEVYGDVEPRPDDADRSAYQLFVALKKEKFRFGFQGIRQTRDVPGGDALDLDIASVFAVFNTGDKGAVVFRYDRMMDPNPDAERIPYLTFSPEGKSSLALLGYDIKIHKNISIIPNVEWVTYAAADGAAEPDDSLMVRVSASWKF